jgi:hypothetical protein
LAIAEPRAIRFGQRSGGSKFYVASNSERHPHIDPDCPIFVEFALEIALAGS